MMNEVYSEPPVSVIIPAYNVEDYIAEAIESVANQTFDDWELIVVDDGSTDSTVDIVEEQFNKITNNRTTLIRQENAGQSVARNRGLSIASGSYIYFLDSDDYLNRNTLSSLYQTVIDNNLDIILFSSLAFADDKNPIGDDKRVRQRIEEYDRYADRHVESLTIRSGKQYLVESVQGNHFIPSSPFGLYRREILGDNPFITGIVYEDNPFMVSVLLRAGKIGVINDKYYMRRIRMGSTMHENKPNYYRNFISRFIISETIRKFLNDNHANKDVVGALTDLYSEFVSLALSDYSHFVENDAHSIDILDSIAPTSNAIFKAYYADRNKTIRELRLKDEEIHKLKDEIESIRHSRSFRIGVLLTSIPRFILSKIINFGTQRHNAHLHI